MCGQELESRRAIRSKIPRAEHSDDAVRATTWPVEGQAHLPLVRTKIVSMMETKFGRLKSLYYYEGGTGSRGMGVLTGQKLQESQHDDLLLSLIDDTGAALFASHSSSGPDQR